MQTKDIITLSFSCLALLISFFNFYAQHLRKRDRLISNLIQPWIDSGEWDRSIEFSLCNVGDNQLIIKQVDLLRYEPEEYDGECDVPRSLTAEVPLVLKPGEVAILRTKYHSADIRKNGEVVGVEFGILSARGRSYDLFHPMYQGQEMHSQAYRTFKLKGFSREVPLTRRFAKNLEKRVRRDPVQ